LSFLNLISTYVISSRYFVILLPFISIFLTPIISYVLSNDFSPVYFNLEKKIIPIFIFIYFIFSIIHLVLPYSNSKLNFYNLIINDEFLKSKSIYFLNDDVLNFHHFNSTKFIFPKDNDRLKRIDKINFVKESNVEFLIINNKYSLNPQYTKFIDEYFNLFKQAEEGYKIYLRSGISE